MQKIDFDLCIVISNPTWVCFFFVFCTESFIHDYALPAEPCSTLGQVRINPTSVGSQLAGRVEICEGTTTRTWHSLCGVEDVGEEWDTDTASIFCRQLTGSSQVNAGNANCKQYIYIYTVPIYIIFIVRGVTISLSVYTNSL